MADNAGETLKFGTSGLRGLAVQLAGAPAFHYTVAFLQMLLDRGEVQAGADVLLGRDLRYSSPDILRICAAGVEAVGLMPVDCGAIPTPALALAAMQRGVPAIMVTGSHIPADRNGLKFYRASGEIDKNDEAGIAAGALTATDAVVPPLKNPLVYDDRVRALYIDRYRNFFAPESLKGLTIGVWEHSSVARDLLAEVLAGMGARVVPLGRSDKFVAVDTEAVSAEDRERAKGWVKEHGLDAIVSTDGDADRPLMFDADGNFVDGDLVGAITAHELGADVIVSPVTSNSSLEGCGRFVSVLRCRVGSPYVIADMAGATGDVIVGFEANGGVLLGSDVTRNGKTLTALPTRDCMLPLLSCLVAVARERKPLATIGAGFGFKSKSAGRLEHVAPSLGNAFLHDLIATGDSSNRFAERGGVSSIDRSDGVRMTLGEGSVVHYRMSGNAPELRCYTEAATQQQADSLLEFGFALARRFIEECEAA